MIGLNGIQIRKWEFGEKSVQKDKDSFDCRVKCFQFIGGWEYVICLKYYKSFYDVIIDCDVELD